jgi:hypothetical protein
MGAAKGKGPAVNTILKITFYVSLATLVLAWWNRDSLPAEIEAHKTLASDPRQVEVAMPPFTVSEGGVDYHVEPLFEYDLYGLVVSRRHHDGDRMLHRLWNDHLNVADLCVVWGRNAKDVDLGAFSFRSGQFTCFFRTRDEQAWQRFQPHQLSNNHLITEDPWLRDAIADVDIGDQVRVSGYLANYGVVGSPMRGTSTTRTDRGNGACETLYVKRFEVLAASSSPWRTAQGFSLWGALLSAFIWVVGVARGSI